MKEEAPKKEQSKCFKIFCCGGFSCGSKGAESVKNAEKKSEADLSKPEKQTKEATLDGDNMA